MKSTVYQWNHKLSDERKAVLPGVQRMSQNICAVAKIVSVFLIMQITLLATFFGLQDGSIPAAFQAGIFLSGFLFLALAIDTKDKSLAIMLAITGLVLPLLAVLSQHIAINFSLLAMAIISLWIGTAVIVRDKLSHAASKLDKIVEAE